MRLHWLMLALAACGSKSDPGVPEHYMPVEGTAGGVEKIDRIALPGDGVPRTKGAIDDPRMHLQPDEGTLTIDTVTTRAGAEATAIVRITPGAGFHVSTEIPTTLTLAPPPSGVTIAKPRFEAGRGQKGDADEFSERSLSFAVTATAAKPGTYALTGVFNFGVCRSDTCHSKKQPITITVTAS